MKIKNNLHNSRIGVDIGGTFTDIVIIENGKINTYKLLTQTLDSQTAITKAIDTLVVKTTPQEFLHSTTLVTNMLLEHKGVKTGLITTQGMRDILHIARHKRPLNYAIKQLIPWQHHCPIPRQWRLTIPERVTAHGNILVPLDVTALKRAVKKLVAVGVEAIAVCFLHAYSYPRHEKLAKKIIKALYPQLAVTISSEVSARFREYERFTTTALNARVLPRVLQYLNELSKKIDHTWPKLKLTIMTNTGGLETVNFSRSNPQAIQNLPIKLALSGLAAAGNAFTAIAKTLRLPNCIGIDVGGTSSDVIVIKNNKLHEAPLEQRNIAGFAVQIPMLDLHTLGAGGGSIISRDEFGELRVGPESAGSNPGPACYNFGGFEPTLTDAAIIAGRIPAITKLADKLQIVPDLAYQAMRKKFKLVTQAEAIKISLNALTLAENKIGFAVREQTVARGLNPKEMALIAAGGAGGMLACGIASSLEITTVVVPPNPGLLAAWGLLVAPHHYEGTIAVLKNLNVITPHDLKKYSKNLNKQLSSAHGSLLYIVAMRYFGQGFEVEVEFASKIPSAQILAKAFHAAHKKEYGFNLPTTEIEVIEIRARKIQSSQFSDSKTELSTPYKLQANQLLQSCKTSATCKPATCFTAVWDFSKSLDKPKKIRAALLHRNALPVGYKTTGPLIVTEESATTYVPHGWQMRVLGNGFLIITAK